MSVTDLSCLNLILKKFFLFLRTPIQHWALLLFLENYIIERKERRILNQLLTLDEYQDKALFTLIYNNKDLLFHYAALGLNGEAGEVAEHAKKSLRDDDQQVTPERRIKIASELGDVLWYVALCCSALGLSMGDVAASNISKLKSREERGVLGGSGSSR